MKCIDRHLQRMNTKTPLLAAATALIVAACQTTKPPSASGADRFRSNLGDVFLKADEAARLANSWDNETDSRLSQTTVPSRHREWVKNFIALSHAQGTTPCRSLRLESIIQLPQAPFEAQVTSEKEPRRFEPINYYESWLVHACSKRAFWRIFEDKPGRYDTPNVMLWRALDT